MRDLRLAEIDRRGAVELFKRGFIEQAIRYLRWAMADFVPPQEPPTYAEIAAWFKDQSK